MAWNDDPSHPFAGIAEKLKRADENIEHLNREILVFFEASDYPVIPHKDAEGWQEAVDYHSGLRIPIRFSVLCGEVIHHFRSCLDHIAWHFSCATYRMEHETSILFPVIFEAPTKDELARYARNVKGIAKPTVLDLIQKLQPYTRGDNALSDPLHIIHDMDRFDKHRELAIVINCVMLTMPPILQSEMLALYRYSQMEPLTPSETIAAQQKLKAHVKATPQVAFAQFGKGTTQPVVPGLTQLRNALDNIVTRFAEEI